MEEILSLLYAGEGVEASRNEPTEVVVEPILERGIGDRLLLADCDLLGGLLRDEARHSEH